MVHPGEAFLRLRESERKARYEEEPQITQITGVTQMKEQFFGGVLLSSAVFASSFFFFICVIRAICVIRGSSSFSTGLAHEVSRKPEEGEDEIVFQRRLLEHCSLWSCFRYASSGITHFPSTHS
jgi:hypothetical protein